MMDLYTAKSVLKLLKEVAGTRKLTSDEQHIGRIAAKIVGYDIHQAAIVSHDQMVAEELKRMKTRGYSESEALAEIAIEEFNARIDRGFGKSKRCRIGAPNCTPLRSHCDFTPLEYTPAYELLGLA